MPRSGERIKDAQVTCVEWTVLPANLGEWDLNDLSCAEGDHDAPASRLQRVDGGNAIAGAKYAILARLHSF